MHKRRRNTKENKSLSQSRDRLQLIAFERQNWHKKELTKERRNKRRSRSDRWRFVLGAPRVDLEEISINVVDASKYIHYPASINDIARVMYWLPAEMLEGLTAIELCLGAEYQEEFLYKEEISYKPDPFVGRCGCEVLPGVFSGVSLANYSRSPATIRLFAYVCDPALPNREMWELYLRLLMLKQFVWQLARHHHFTAQLARKTGEDSERYAYRVVSELMLQCVIPYLEQAYPEALSAMDVWMQQHCSLSVPLSQLMAKPNLLEAIYLSEGALKKIVWAIATGGEQTEALLRLAWGLYDTQNYAAALEIASRILSEQPNHTETISLMAHIYLKQENIDAFQTFADRLTSGSECSFQAWLWLAEIHEVKQEWAELLNSASSFLENNWIYFSEKTEILKKCARARLELGDFERLEADLEQITQIDGSSGAEFAAQLRSEWRSRTS